MWLAAPLAGACLLAAPCTSAAEKAETWIEVRSPHFVVISNAGDKPARRIAEQLEMIRGVFQLQNPQARLDSGLPFLIFAVKGEKDLKSLLPEYWETKGRSKPAGVFFPGQEKYYAALRMDNGSDQGRHIVFHEYVHSLDRSSGASLPVWVEEGVAEFFGHMVPEGKRVRLGERSIGSIEVLQRSSLLPLEQLFAVDHNSPHYSQKNKSTIFYAQSWALVHYLFMDPEVRQAKLLRKYGELIQGGVNAVEAARQAFGDLRKLQKRLESYIREENYFIAHVPAPPEIDEKTFPARVLPPAEAVALRGDFFVHTNRPVEAAASLHEALRLDPNMARAHESLGFLHFRQGRPQDAARELAEAARLNSGSFLTHYWLAMLTSQDSGHEGALDDAEQHLRRTIELNKDFAGAYSTLATFLVRHDDKAKKDEALVLARKAVELEPGTLVFHLNLGHVLLRHERAAEARQIGQRVLQAARTESDRQNATVFLNSVHGYEEFLARRKKYEEEAREAEARREEFRKKLEEQRRREEAEAAATPAPAAPLKKGRSAPPPRTRHTAATGSSASIEGRITALACADPARMEITLAIGAYTLKLRSLNYFKVEYLLGGTWAPPANFNPCLHLKGLLVKAAYTTLLNQPQAGELISVEVKK